MAKTVFAIGEKIGQLTIVGELPNSACRHRQYAVRCSCGTERAVRGSHLRPGRTVSCGCHRRDVTRGRALTHGEARERTAEYECWKAMKARCHNSNLAAFKDYGGRGISVCPRWLESYENFLADVGRRPSPQHSIDRYPDNDGNYEPGNVRWSTPTEQNNNRRPFRPRVSSDGVAA